MEKKFKRSFRGYHPAEVDSKIKDLEDEYRQKAKAMKDELAGEVQRMQLLKAEMESLKEELKKYKELEDQISGVLLEAHLKGTQKVQQALAEAGEAEKKAAQSVQTRKKELNRLKASMDKIKEEILRVANQYKMTIEEKSGEE